jgi:enterochelin esterase family protein
VGVFSSGWFNPADRQWWYDHKAADVVPRLNKELKVFWWGWGATDFAKPGAVELVDYFKSKGVKIITRESAGGHDWRNWRLYFYEFAPLLFK